MITSTDSNASTASNCMGALGTVVGGNEGRAELRRRGVQRATARLRNGRVVPDHHRTAVKQEALDLPRHRVAVQLAVAVPPALEQSDGIFRGHDIQVGAALLARQRDGGPARDLR